MCLVERVDGLQQLIASRYVEARCRLVEQQKPRLDDEMAALGAMGSPMQSDNVIQLRG